MPSSRLQLRHPRVIRYLVQVEGTADVLDARAFEQLTDHAVITREKEAWRLLEAIRRMRGNNCVLISTASGTTPDGADTLVIFMSAFGTAIVERHGAIYAIYRDGRLEREPIRTQPLESWITHSLLAIVAAALLHWANKPIGQILDIGVRVPVIAIVIVFVLIQTHRRR